MVNVSGRSTDKCSDVTLAPDSQNLEEYKEKINANNNRNNYNSVKNYDKMQYGECLSKLDLDELSIPTTRSFCSEMHSSGSDTLRNNYGDGNDGQGINYQPIKMFIKRNKSSDRSQKFEGTDSINEDFYGNPYNYNNSENNSGYKTKNRADTPKSPRTLFLGLDGWKFAPASN